MNCEKTSYALVLNKPRQRGRSCGYQFRRFLSMLRGAPRKQVFEASKRSGTPSRTRNKRRGSAVRRLLIRNYNYSSMYTAHVSNLENRMLNLGRCLTGLHSSPDRTSSLHKFTTTLVSLIFKINKSDNIRFKSDHKSKSVRAKSLVQLSRMKAAIKKVRFNEEVSVVLIPNRFEYTALAGRDWLWWTDSNLSLSRRSFSSEISAFHRSHPKVDWRTAVHHMYNSRGTFREGIPTPNEILNDWGTLNISEMFPSVLFHQTQMIWQERTSPITNILGQVLCSPKIGTLLRANCLLLLPFILQR